MNGIDEARTSAALRRLDLPDAATSRALLLLLDQTVSRLDANGKILGVWLGNRDYVSNIGDHRLDLFESAPTQYVTDLVDPETREGLLRTIRESIRTGERQDVEFSTGTTGKDLRLAGSCLPCGPGEVLWVTRDLTEQFEAQRTVVARADLEATVSDALQSLVGVDGERLAASLDSVMERIGRYFGARSTFLRRFRDPTHVEIVAQWRSPDLEPPSPGRSRAGGQVFPWAARRLAQHPILVVQDLEALGPEAATDVAHRMTRTSGRGLVWIRIGPPKQPTGLLGMVFADPLPSGADDLYGPLLGLAHALLAVVNRALDDRRREIQHRVFELVAHGSPLEDVLSEVCRFRESGWPGQRTVIWLWNEAGDVRAFAVGETAEMLTGIAGIEPGDALMDVLADGNRQWLTRDESPGDWGPFAERIAATAIEVTPLSSVGHSSVAGLMTVYDSSDDPIDANRAEDGFGDLAASLAAVAVERDHNLRSLAHRVMHDDLTGLANRTNFLAALEDAIAEVSSSGSLTAVFYCDIDRFKEMNDRLGHAMGDHLLQLVGARLAEQVGDAGLVARLGGDEFAVLIQELSDEEEALGIADAMRESVRDLSVPGHRSVTISIGVAVSAADGDHADGVLRDADMAMYQAKSGGRNRVEVFRERIRRETQERDRLARDLALAIADERLEVHYQPMIALASGKLTGFEALVRWQHPDRGAISPEVFVPIAESGGLIGHLGDFVLARALECAKAWNGLALHVNLSPHQVDAARSVDGIIEAVRGSQIPPGKIAMEITENVLLSESGVTSRNLDRLLDSGIGLVLDDFGTGYASLTYLQRIPFRGIKVDKSFVAGMEVNPGDATIVAMVLGLAASLALDVVAEGVETAEQEEALRRMGCAHVQGFRYSRAVPARDVPALIERFGIHGDTER